jgi:hypothetical protein
VTGRGTFALVQGAVLWYDQANKEKVDNVENSDTPNNLLGSFRNFPGGVGSLGSSQASELSSSVGERRSDENSAKAMEAIEERRPRRVPIFALLALPVIASKVFSLPVSCTNVTSVVCWNAAAVDDDSKNHEAYASGDLHDTKDELDLFRVSLILRTGMGQKLASP